MSESFEQITERLTSRFKAMTPEQEEKHREMIRRARLSEIRIGWNAPLRHLDCAADLGGKWGETFEKAKAKLGSGSLVALIGGRGNGKTQMAVELMKHVTREDRKAYFLSAMEFFMEIKGTYKRDSDDSESSVIEKFSKSSFLVIDEFGKRGGTEWENNLLFELLNRRYNRMADTLLIDNRTKAEFIETIGPSLASRMNEGGGILECTWESFRK